jgi:signal peptidase I
METNGAKYDYIRFANWVYAFQRKGIRYYKTCVGRVGYKIVYKNSKWLTDNIALKIIIDEVIKLINEK